MLSDLCNNVKDQCDPLSGGHAVYVGLEHIDLGSYRLRRHGVPSDVHSSKFQFQRGDILYGKLRPYLDKAVLAEQDGMCSTDILVLRPKPDVVPVYLLSVLHSRALREFAAATTHGVNHPRTSWAALSSFVHEKPAYVDQARSAAALWTIQKALDAELLLLERARNFKRALLQRLFTCGLDAGERAETPLGLLPKRWTVRPFSELRAFLQYGTSAKCDYSSGGIGVLRIPNILAGKIDAADLKRCSLDDKTVKSLLLEIGDVLFVRTNGVKERVGTCAVYEGEPSPTLFASYLIRARLNRDLVDPHFLQYYTDTATGASFLSGRSSPAADGKFNVNTKTIDSMLVPVAPLPDQERIASALRQIDAAVEADEAKRSALTRLFTAILEGLMSGELQPQQLEVDTSEVTTG